MIPSARHIRALLMLVLALAGTGLEMARAQTPIALDPRLKFRQYIHHTWKRENGLPQETVNDVVQDRTGFIWLATQAGLVRFDGLNFRTFYRGNTPGLSSNQILSLFVDRTGDLWIGTDGEGIVRMHAGKFTSFSKIPGLKTGVIRCIYQDRSGILWFGTMQDGLIKYDGKRFSNLTVKDGLTSNTILAITEDQSGGLWLGTDNGLTHLQGDRLRTFRPSDGLPGTIVTALASSHDGGVWLGFYDGNGLCKFKNSRFDCAVGDTELKRKTISSIFEDPSGGLWVGTLGNGLIRLFAGKASIFDTKNGLSHDKVRSVLYDRDGNLWIGTEGGGLNRLGAGRFATFGKPEGLTNEIVYTVLEDRARQIWIGTDGGGLFKMVGDRANPVKASNQLPSGFVYALHEDRSRALWVGLFDGGLCRLADNRYTCFGQKDGLRSSNVFAIYEDSRRDLWIGTDAGLYTSPSSATPSFSQSLGMSGSLVTSITEDRQRRVWVGTYEDGLFVFTNGRPARVTTAEGMPSRSILSLHVDLQGTLWVGTRGDGVCRLQGNKFRCFKSHHGLATDDVLQILDDPTGNIWIGTMEGLLRIPRNQFDEVVTGRKRQLSPVVYAEADGIRSSEFNGGTQPSAWRARDGSLWFSTMRGVVTTSSARMESSAPPVVTLDEITVNDLPVTVEGATIRIGPGVKNMRISFSAVSFSAPDQLRFQYQLEGNDNTWVNNGSERFIALTNLSPGMYKLRVRAADSEHGWGKSFLLVSFKVVPAWYQTIWFYLLSAVALVGLILAVPILRLRQSKMRQAELQLLVGQRTRELRAREEQLEDANRTLEALNHGLEAEVTRQIETLMAERTRYEGELIAARDRAEESARLKSNILNNMSHELRTPLTAILGSAQILSSEVTEEHREFVDYIEDNGRRLLETLNSILDMSRLENQGMSLSFDRIDLCQCVDSIVSKLKMTAQKKGIRLEAQLPSSPVESILDRSALDRIIYNLVGNAIKFTDEGEVIVKIESTDNLAVLHVQDTGIGIAEEFLPRIFEEFQQESSGLARSYEGSGLGLAVTRRLVEIMGGAITVRSQKGAGTTFTVTFRMALDAVSIS